jgi:hypothetical protein
MCVRTCVRACVRAACACGWAGVQAGGPAHAEHCGGAEEAPPHTPATASDGCVRARWCRPSRRAGLGRVDRSGERAARAGGRGRDFLPNDFLPNKPAVTSRPAGPARPSRSRRVPVTVGPGGRAESVQGAAAAPEPAAGGRALAAGGRTCAGRAVWRGAAERRAERRADGRAACEPCAHSLAPSGAPQPLHHARRRAAAVGASVGQGRGAERGSQPLHHARRRAPCPTCSVLFCHSATSFSWPGMKWRAGLRHGRSFS